MFGGLGSQGTDILSTADAMSRPRRLRPDEARRLLQRPPISAFAVGIWKGVQARHAVPVNAVGLAIGPDDAETMTLWRVLGIDRAMRSMAAARPQTRRLRLFDPGGAGRHAAPAGWLGPEPATPARAPRAPLVDFPAIAGRIGPHTAAWPAERPAR
jgi:hypothetical protein